MSFTKLIIQQPENTRHNETYLQSSDALKTVSGKTEWINSTLP